MVAGGELFLEVDEEADVFLGLEAAGEAEGEGAVLAEAFVGVEEFGIDAAGHEVDGLAGAVLEHVDEVGVGGEEGGGELVELSDAFEGTPFGEEFDEVGVGLGEEAEEGVFEDDVKAVGGEFVEVVVPGGDEGDFVVMGEIDAHEADVAGAGDVDEVGLEAADGVADAKEVAAEERVEGEVLVDGDGCGGAAEFEDGGGAVGGVLGDCPAPDAKERQALAASEGIEFAAGTRHAVHFVERVGKISYTYSWHDELRVWEDAAVIIKVSRLVLVRVEDRFEAVHGEALVDGGLDDFDFGSGEAAGEIEDLLEDALGAAAADFAGAGEGVSEQGVFAGVGVFEEAFELAGGVADAEVAGAPDGLALNLLILVLDVGREVFGEAAVEAVPHGLEGEGAGFRVLVEGFEAGGEIVVDVALGEGAGGAGAFEGFGGIVGEDLFEAGAGFGIFEVDGEGLPGLGADFDIGVGFGEGPDGGDFVLFEFLVGEGFEGEAAGFGAGVAEVIDDLFGVEDVEDGRSEGGVVLVDVEGGGGFGEGLGGELVESELGFGLVVGEGGGFGVERGDAGLDGFDEGLAAVEGDIDGGVGGVGFEAGLEEGVDAGVFDAKAGEEEFDVGLGLGAGFGVDGEEGFDGGGAEFGEGLVDFGGIVVAGVVEEFSVYGDGLGGAEGAEEVEDLGAEVDADLLVHVQKERDEGLGRVLRIAFEDRLDPGVVDADAAEGGLGEEFGDGGIRVAIRSE